MKQFGALLLLTIFIITTVINDVIAASIKAPKNVQLGEGVQLVKRNDYSKRDDNNQPFVYQPDAVDCTTLNHHCAFAASGVYLTGDQDGTYCPCTQLDYNGYGRGSCQYPAEATMTAVCDNGFGSVTVYFGQYYSFFTTSGTIFVNWVYGTMPGKDPSQSTVQGDNVNINCSGY